MAWLAANLQLLSPLVVLTLDIKPYCAHLFKSKLFWLLTILFSLLIYYDLLVRYQRGSNVFSLYNFVQSFRLESFGVLAAEVAIYHGVIHATRRLLVRQQQRSLQPAV